MIRQRSLARRYALALAELARDRGELEAVEQGLRRVLAELQASPQLQQVWTGQRLEPAQRVERMRELLGGDLPQILYNFLGVVAAKGRQELLAAMAEEFFVEADRMRQIERVEVLTAAPLTEEEQALLERELARYLEVKAVRLSVKVQPELLGGIVVRAGDRYVDFSLSRQLQELHQRLRMAPLEGAVAVDGKAG